MKTRLTLEEEGTSLPLVERLLDDGSVVQSRRVRAAELHHQLVSCSDEWMLLHAMLERGGHYGFVDRLFQMIDVRGMSEEAEKLVQGIITYASKSYLDKLKHLFRLLLNTVQPDDLEPEQFRWLISELLRNVGSLSDPDEVLEHFKGMLEVLQVFDKPGAETAKAIVRAAVTNVREWDSESELKDLWTFLSSKVKKEAILEIALPYMDEYQFSMELPKGCVFTSYSPVVQTYFIEVDRCRIDVNLTGDIYPNVEHPKLLFWFRVETKSGKYKAFCAAVKDADVTKDSRLYRYPFSNVYTNNFELCWGNMPQFTRVQDLARFPFFFLMNEKNFHSYPQTGGMEYRDLLQVCSEFGFKDEWLQDTGRTVANFL